MFTVPLGALELRMMAVELVQKLNMAHPTMSQSAMRGRKITEDEGLKRLEYIK